MNITFSTALTLLRIVLVPFIVLAMIMQQWIGAISLFFVAAVSDALDGYFARLWNQETELGAYLDPLADKILITACYATLVFFPIPNLAIPTWFLGTVLVKELLLLAGACYFGLFKDAITIRPSVFGKLAMFVQTILVVWLLLCMIFGWVPVKTLYGILGLALGLVIVSLVHYALDSFDSIVGLKK